MTGPWKKRRTCESVATEVDVDLSEFDVGQLLQELLDRGVIDEAIACALLAREKPQLPDAGIEDELSCAREELARGRASEAIIHIERLLGREWIGSLSSSLRR